MMLVTNNYSLFHWQQLSLNYLSIIFYPEFDHLLPPLTTGLVLSHNVELTYV